MSSRIHRFGASAIGAGVSVALAASLTPGLPAQQGPGGGEAGPGSAIEARLAELERQVRQERPVAQAQDATFTVAWVATDTAGIPELQDPSKAPGVASTVDLKLWGRVNFAATYDNFQGASGIGGPDYMNYVTAQGNEELSFQGKDTRFGFAAASAVAAWTGRAVVELDFYGDSSSANLAPRLRLGYVELAHEGGCSLRAGQDWVPIAQQNPGTIDFGILAFGGNLWNRVPQVTARWQGGAHELLLSAMHLRTQNAQDQQERMPWVVGRYAWRGLLGDQGLLALGAGVRKATLVDAGGAAHAKVTDHVVAAEARLPVVDGVLLTAEAWTGAGVGREFLRTGLDYNSAGEAIAGRGGFLSGEWKFAERWTCNLGGGIDQPDDADTTVLTWYAGAVPYDSNRALFANVRCQLSKQLGIGAEVIDFRTEMVDGVAASADGQVRRGQRCTLGMWFVF